jgi:hypothetical protein
MQLIPLHLELNPLVSELTVFTKLINHQEQSIRLSRLEIYRILYFLHPICRGQ